LTRRARKEGVFYEEDEIGRSIGTVRRRLTRLLS
jgi:hypothetical protein